MNKKFLTFVLFGATSLQLFGVLDKISKEDLDKFKDDDVNSSAASDRA